MDLISRNLLLVVCQIAGATLLAGVIWLLRSRVIFLDRETKRPIEFEFPVFGKLKTQHPVLAVILIGAGLLVYPVTVSRSDQVTVEGEIETDGKPVTVTVVPMPQFQQTMQSSGPFKIQVPVLPDVNYRALFSVDRHIESDSPFDLQQHRLVKFRHMDSSISETRVTLQREVSDAELQRLGIN